MFKWNSFLHITQRVVQKEEGEKKEKCRLTKRCSAIKVTHIPGFITIRKCANVAASLMGTGVKRGGRCFTSH